jgi:putative chitinase
MVYDREIFFDHVRDDLFSGALTQEQVDGMGVILAVWEYQGGGTPMDDQRWLAYMLATTYHETAQRMWPITEYGSEDYLKSKEYYPYVGRGLVQLTWESNYDHASAALSLTDDRDLVKHPEMALDSLISARILFRGMAEGWFTGKKLGQFFNETKDDPVNARQIINGNDCDDQIAGYHREFLGALQAAYTGAPPEPEVPTIAMDMTVEGNANMSVLINGVLVWESDMEIPLS